jgi:zinc protease
MKRGGKSKLQGHKPRVSHKSKIRNPKSKIQNPKPALGLIPELEAHSSFDFIKEKAGIREFRLRANGLKLLLVQNRVAPVVTFAVVYCVGSRNEAVGYTGATHLLEHLMFKGTPDYNRENGTAIAAVLEALGARFNATTWFDRTNYYETLPSAELDVAVKIEASRMRGSLIRDSDRQPEMTVVRNEFERGENSPFQVLYKHTFATAFREHPYHHPTIGWRSDIESVTTARLKEFYDVFYHPNNATAMVIGDFEEKEALAKVARHFGSIPPSATPIPEVHTVEPPQEGERRFTVRRSGQVAWCGLAWRTVEALHPDTHTLAVLGNILGGGMTSRLYQALVEKSLALSVTAVPWQLRDPALLSIFAPVRPGVEPASVESAIREEVARVAREGVTPAETEKARTQIEAEVIFDRDSTDQVAASLSEAIAAADWEWYADYPEAIRRVSPEDVRRVARAYLNDESLTVGIFLPKPEHGEVPGPPPGPEDQQAPDRETA